MDDAGRGYVRALRRFRKASTDLAVAAGRLAAKDAARCEQAGRGPMLLPIFDRWFADHDALIVRLRDDLDQVIGDA